MCRPLLAYRGVNLALTLRNDLPERTGGVWGDVPPHWEVGFVVVVVVVVVMFCFVLNGNRAIWWILSGANIRTGDEKKYMLDLIIGGGTILKVGGGGQNLGSKKWRVSADRHSCATQGGCIWGGMWPPQKLELFRKCRLKWSNLVQ